MTGRKQDTGMAPINLRGLGEQGRNPLESIGREVIAYQGAPGQQCPRQTSECSD
jgi:hypothetical protein